MLDFVGVLLRVGVDTFHTSTLWRSVNTGLSCVDIVVQTVESTDSDHGWETFCKDLHVLKLVDSAWAHWRVVWRVRMAQPRGPRLVRSLAWNLSRPRATSSS